MKNIILWVVSLAAFCSCSEVEGAAIPKLGLRFLPPDQMNSGYSVGDVFSTSDLEGRIIDLRAEPWPSRFKGALDQPGPPVTAASAEYGLVRDTSAVAGTTLPQFRLSADLSGGMKALLTVKLKNARTHTLSLTAIEKSYVPRFRYWNNPNRVDGKFVITELLTADELEIRQADSKSASAAAAFKAMRQALGAANFEIASASEAAITLKGAGLAVAYQAWKIPTDQPPIGGKLSPITFQERIPGGQSFELTLPQDGPNADITHHSEYVGHAEISAQTNALYLRVGARIFGPTDTAPRAHFHTPDAAVPTFRLNTLSYLEGTRLKVDSSIKSDLRRWETTGAESLILSGDKSVGPLVEQWHFKRIPNPKFCVVTLREFIATVSLDR